MYAFQAFKWGPTWLEQICFIGRKIPQIPPNSYKIKNYKSNLTIQAEQGAPRCSNPCSTGMMAINGLNSAEEFPFMKQTPDSTTGQGQPLNN